jgi:hypothetical protein
VDYRAQRRHVITLAQPGARADGPLAAFYSGRTGAPGGAQPVIDLGDRPVVVRGAEMAHPPAHVLGGLHVPRLE